MYHNPTAAKTNVMQMYCILVSEQGAQLLPIASCMSKVGHDNTDTLSQYLSSAGEFLCKVPRKDHPYSAFKSKEYHFLVDMN